MDAFVQSNPVLADGFGWAKVPAADIMAEMVNGPTSPWADDEDCYPTPLAVSTGPSTRSTSLDLESWPSVVWDVNGYYHALGVGFRATRKQLRIAYYQLGGPNDAYLTYVFKQLLDSQVRRQYDACELGEVFLDRYVEAALKERARKVAQQFGMPPEKVMEGWGFTVVEPDYEPEPDTEEEAEPDSDSVQSQSEPVDIPQEAGDDGRVPVTRSEPWPYSFYLWRMRRRDRWFSDSDVMRRWQEAIAAECYRRGKAVTFAVGVMGKRMGPDPRVLSADGTRVALIAIDQFDRIDQLAPEAVDRLTNLRD